MPSRSKRYQAICGASINSRNTWVEVTHRASHNKIKSISHRLTMLKGIKMKKRQRKQRRWQRMKQTISKKS